MSNLEHHACLMVLCQKVRLGFTLLVGLPSLSMPFVLNHGLLLHPPILVILEEHAFQRKVLPKYFLYCSGMLPMHRVNKRVSLKTDEQTDQLVAIGTLIECLSECVCFRKLLSSSAYTLTGRSRVFRCCFLAPGKFHQRIGFPLFSRLLRAFWTA